MLESMPTKGQVKDVSPTS